MQCIFIFITAFGRLQNIVLICLQRRLDQSDTAVKIKALEGVVIYVISHVVGQRPHQN